MNKRQRAILVGTVLGRGNLFEEEESVKELGRLADTAGAQVIDNVVQRRERPDAAYFIGKGKVEELAAAVRDSGADLVIFDHGLSPSQSAKIQSQLECRVVDRTELIMDIFALHARTAEAKIQVELAQLQYRFSRLVGAGLEMTDPGAGIGTRGPGEKQLELDRRKIRHRIARLKLDLKKVEQQRRIQRKSRENVFQVALVGYTNAGKSTLMNLLSKARVKVEDRLFATLDSTTRAVVLPSGERFLLTDTVGFIRRLPHQLVASFRATLEEVNQADLILHVVDSPHPLYSREIEAVEEVLKEIKVDRPALLVFNKIDQLDPISINELKNRFPEAAFISALNGQGRRELEDMIRSKIEIRGIKGPVGRYIIKDA
jgi:GTP-binding protein HflX